MKKDMKQKKDQPFADAFKELEEIVKKFESGKLDLDESLNSFERGLELASLCKKYLGQVENRVHEIKKKFSKDDLFDNEDAPD